VALKGDSEKMFLRVSVRGGGRKLHHGSKSDEKMSRERGRGSIDSTSSVGASCKKKKKARGRGKKNGGEGTINSYRLKERGSRIIWNGGDQ